MKYYVSDGDSVKEFDVLSRDREIIADVLDTFRRQTINDLHLDGFPYITVEGLRNIMEQVERNLLEEDNVKLYSEWHPAIGRMVKEE